MIRPFLALLLLIGCGTPGPSKRESLREWMEPNGKLKVLATTGMIADLVKAVGDQEIDIITLIHGDLDPHSYQLVKGDDEKLGFANLIFYNGLGLEHSPSIHRALADNPRAVPLGDEIARVRPNDILTFGQDVDPHIWMDLSLFKLSIPIIVQSLSEKDPAHAELYRKRGQIAYREVDQLDHKIADLMENIPENKRYFVTSHDAFNYFTKRYLATDEEREYGTWQKRFQAPEGLSPDSQINPHQIQQLLEHLKNYHIEILFPESNLSRDSILKILNSGKNLGLNLRMAEIPLYGDAMGPPGSSGDTYQKMMWYNASTIHDYLIGEK